MEGWSANESAKFAAQIYGRSPEAFPLGEYLINKMRHYYYL
jgi:hypothetical protein